MIAIERHRDGLALYPVLTLNTPLGTPVLIVPEDELADALAALLDNDDSFATDWDAMADASRLAIEAA